MKNRAWLSSVVRGGRVSWILRFSCLGAVIISPVSLTAGWLTELGLTSATVAGIGTAGFALAGCGKKGPPHAPEYAAPGGVRQLSGVGQVDSITIRWADPKQDPTGGKLDVVRYELRRAVVRNGVAEEPVVLAEVAHADPSQSGPRSNAIPFYMVKDTQVQVGVVYDYSVVPVMASGHEVDPQTILRATFRGESTPFEPRAAVENPRAANR